MQISRDTEGLRFIGECAPESGFVAGDIRCVRVAVVLIHTLTLVMFRWSALCAASKKSSGQKPRWKFIWPKTGIF